MYKSEEPERVKPGPEFSPRTPVPTRGTLSAFSRSAPQERTTSLFKSSECRIADLFPKTLDNMPQTHHLPQGMSAEHRNTPGEDVCAVRWAQTGCFQLLFLGAVAKNTCPVQPPTHCALNKSPGLLLCQIWPQQFAR